MNKEEQLQFLEDQFLQLNEKWVEMALKGNTDNMGVKDIAIEVYKDSLQKYREICIEYGKELAAKERLESIKFIKHE